ncbi:MAG TPA: hypothetical protein DD421_05020 [Clostridiaceae bacterium]|jgi:hypothetical protein|nr:hypothetical protein [Clostridiaceae bacterium]
METKKIMYYEIEREDYMEWGLTSAADAESIHYMKLYMKAENFRLATYMDLLDWICATGEYFEELLELADGYFQFQYKKQDNGYGEYEIYGEYIKVADKKAMVA